MPPRNAAKPPHSPPRPFGLSRQLPNKSASRHTPPVTKDGAPRPRNVVSSSHPAFPFLPTRRLLPHQQQQNTTAPPALHPPPTRARIASPSYPGVNHPFLARLNVPPRTQPAAAGEPVTRPNVPSLQHRFPCTHYSHVLLPRGKPPPPGAHPLPYRSGSSRRLASPALHPAPLPTHPHHQPVPAASFSLLPPPGRPNPASAPPSRRQQGSIRRNAAKRPRPCPLLLTPG